MSENPNRRVLDAELLQLSYRRVTEACAQNDWKEKNHDAVISGHKGDDIIVAFLRRPLASELNPPNVMDRKRESKNAGPREIGKLTTEGWRAWLWFDDGTDYDPEGIGASAIWMIARGRRNSSSKQQDLQKTHVELLADPDDTWRPTDADYDVLLEEIAGEWARRADAAIISAVAESHERPGHPIDVQIERIEAVVMKDEIVIEEVAGCVVESYGIRYLAIAHRFANGDYLDEALVLTLAETAFADLEEGTPWGESAGDIRVGEWRFSQEQFWCYEGELSP